MRPVVLTVVLLVTPLLVLGGCAHSAKSAEVTKLRKRMEELAQRSESDRQQIDELQTRLFLLEDRVDTEVTARARTRPPPRHPTIRIRPGDDDQPSGTTAPAPTSRSEPSAGGGSSVVAVDTVEYGGAARMRGPRPLLKLDGTGRRLSGGATAPRQSSSDAAVLDGIDPALVSEKIPVLPLPKRRASLKIANTNGGLKDYRDALRLYRKGDYPKAIAGFRGFLRGRTNHPYADNALYWLGECFYSTRQYADAVGAFARVVDRYPEGNKVPDAMLKLGYCQMRQGNKAKARGTLSRLRETFPSSNAARLAGETLATIK